MQERLTLFGIAKAAPVRNKTQKLGDASIMLWVLDTQEEIVQACKEGAEFVVTNRPLAMAAAADEMRAKCSQGG